MTETEWFDDADRTPTGEAGLRFECTQCGGCCTGPPGYVLFTDDEADAMAEQLGLDPTEFSEKHTHQTSLGRSLTETKTEHGYDCVFLDRETRPGKALCRVYKARPRQCRDWPFWDDNVRSRDAWDRASKGCPGMNQGPLYSPGHVRLTVSGGPSS